MNTEQQLHWFKSSYSGGEGGSCVEVAKAPGTIHIRDSKDEDGPVLTVSAGAWAGLVGLTVSRR
ncbi:DUF397 domain-containing protein [Streptomyces sp. NPDC002889]|uniref:DUF397 domain-containing protein n=1 Tax=Streptomyces sp. NPDC002889 TaxID=3364669 RepID=UPI0036CBD5D7